jgi:lipopolysaccharide export system permease protein
MEELRHVSFTKHVLSIAVDDMFLRRSESEYRGDREKSAPQMRQEVRTNQQLIAESLKTLNEHVGRDLQRALGTALGLVAADSARSNYQPPARADSLTAVERQQRLTALLMSVRQTLYHIENQLAIVRSYERSNKGLLVEIHKKYSIPVACLVFVIIGAPLGFMARRGGLATGGGLSLGFFLLYWASLIGGEDLADRQFISPFVAMWSANFIVGIVGLYLLRRAAKENVMMDFAKMLWWRKSK